jgi:hypothetical protein
MSLLDVFDEFCGSCQVDDCESCDGGPCQCEHRTAEYERYAYGKPGDQAVTGTGD